MNDGARYPSLLDLARCARRRTPFFAWEYFDSGTGTERLVERDRAALDAICLTPAVLAGRFAPQTATTPFGVRHSVPFGAAPVGMSGLIWPGAERSLAAESGRLEFPYYLSMVANETPESVSRLAGGRAWFQLYALSDPDIQADLLARAERSGIDTLVVTVGVPVGSRRERQFRAGLTVPPKLTGRTLWHIARRPAWALATLRRGRSRFRSLEPYFDATAMRDSVRMVGRVIDGRPGWDFVGQLRDPWRGNLVIKGILRPEDAHRAVSLGVDGLVVSNHGGRQFDGAPVAIDALPPVSAVVGGKAAVLFDSGLRGGLDIVRALASGADFCLLGRDFLYGVVALGVRGAAHVHEILKVDIQNNMLQLGARNIGDLRNLLRTLQTRLRHARSGPCLRLARRPFRGSLTEKHNDRFV